MATLTDVVLRLLLVESVLQVLEVVQVLILETGRANFVVGSLTGDICVKVLDIKVFEGAIILVNLHITLLLCYWNPSILLDLLLHLGIERIIFGAFDLLCLIQILLWNLLDIGYLHGLIGVHVLLIFILAARFDHLYS